jgi:glycosyltransferase involved in cell wall biosynthesis
MKKAVIIELGSSHSECIYSLYLFFEKSGYEVTLVLNNKLYERTGFFRNKCAVHYFDLTGNRNTIRSYVAIRNMLKAVKFDNAVFLTAGGVALRNFLMMPISRKSSISGILHNTDKLSNSVTDRFIYKRMSKFFVLADFMLEYLPEKYCKKTQSIYTVFYPEYSQKNPEIQKSKDEFWVGIPGTVEFSRRDYMGLIRELKEKNIDNNIRFLLLGPGNYRDSNLPEVLKQVKNNRLENSLIHFDGYLKDEDFYSYLQSCDVLLPLIHPDKEQYNKFIKNKITGTYNLSAGFKIPMLCHKAMSSIDDFISTSLFYEYGGLYELIRKLSTDHDYLAKMKSGLFKIEKFGFEYQRKKFVNFLEQ